MKGKSLKSKLVTTVKPTEVAVKEKLSIGSLTKPTAAFTQALAHEIVKNLTNFGQLTTRPFRRRAEKKAKPDVGFRPMLVDTSVLIDGRILSVVNSGFLTGTLIIPQFVLEEVQHIADSSDSLRRSKGRRGLDIINKLRGQKVNAFLKMKIVSDDTNGMKDALAQTKEVDHALVAIARRWGWAILTVDFNMAQVARAQGVKVLNVNDLANAMKVALVPGEELTIKITHEGRERAQGVGYLADGTMVVVDNARDKVGLDMAIVVTKIHQTPAGQLFFARLK